VKNKLIFIYSVCFILLISHWAKAEEILLNVDEAISLGLRENREFLLKNEDVKKAKKKIAESYGGIWPTLDFIGGWTDTKGLSQKDIALTTTQTTVIQTLYQGGKIINTIKHSQYGLEISQALLDKSKLDTVYTIQKAFYTLLLAQESAALNQSILENSKEHLKFLEMRYRQGQASESDILKVKESLGSVDEGYVISLSQIEAAQELLRNILYLEENVTILPQGEFIYAPQEIIYSEAFLKAFEKRPEIRQYAVQVNADKRSVEIAKADNRPTIYASWEYFSRSSSGAIASAGTVTSLNGSSKNWNDYSTTGLIFSWPVFDGWATKAKVEQAIIDLKETELLKEKAVKDIALDVKNAYLGLKDAVASIRSAESNMEFYKSNLNTILQKKYRGEVSFLDADDANLGYNISMFNKSQAVYDYIVAKANFDKATGGNL